MRRADQYTRPSVKATVEPLEGNKVKLSITVDEDELETAIDAAFRKIAREVRIPGFRPGKAPRRVLEARIGTDAARQQAISDAVPDYYAQAVREHEVDVIASPQIDLTDGAESGAVAFDAVVEVRPRVSVPGYEGLRVTLPSPEATDEDVDEQLERLRVQHGELEPVDRPAVDDDFVTIDVAGTQGGEALEGLTADDYLYPLGSGAVVPELDEQLRGSRPGAILQFDAPHPGDPEGDPIELRVLVKEVQARRLPDLDDAFAAEASEMETLEELRADLRERLGQARRAQAQMALREGVANALADLVDDEIPEALVAAELQDRINDLALRLQAQGLTIDQWLAGTGRDQAQFVAELRDAAAISARVDLALRAVAEEEGIEADEEDLEEEYADVASRLELPAEEVRERFERAEQTQAIRSDLKKRKALEWLIEHAELVDQEGQPIDRASLQVEEDPEVSEADGEDDL